MHWSHATSHSFPTWIKADDNIISVPDLMMSLSATKLFTQVRPQF